MAQRTRGQLKEEHVKLVNQIQEWNANRLDLFELTLPNEELEFHGVMRFFHQDEGQKVSTKCIRVSSTATTRDVLNILIEKFRPDMRMLSLPEYYLYELHSNGEERKLQEHERPLFVQLNWGKDDREGRFLLKSEKHATAHLGNFNYGTDISNQQQQQQNIEQPVPFKRKLSKREKKELKKQEKLAKIKGKENDPGKDSVAGQLYNELPDTSFTRSISNPEAVMRRRRQLKLEKKLQQFRSKDGGPDSGGTLKIYGESLCEGLPYKTLLLSTSDTAAYVVKETLDKYGMEKEHPGQYCLVQVHVPPNDRDYYGEGGDWGKEFILDDYDCPLAILMQHPPSKGTITFHLRKKSADMPKRKKKKGQMDDLDQPGFPYYDAQLPYFVELNPDGSEVYKAKHHKLMLNVTEVGSDRGMSASGQYVQLYGNDIHPRHCIVTHTDGVVTVTPTSRDAHTYVEGQRIYETTVLMHGAIIRFGKGNIFRFLNPSFEEQKMKQARSPEGLHPQGPPGYNRVVGGSGEPMQTANFETTFDVDGHVETKEGQQQPGGPGGDSMFSSPGTGFKHADLPAMLEFREEGEDAFLAAIISEVNGAAVQFKLAPTYTLYMAARYRISKMYRPDISPQERAHRLTSLVRKLAHMVQQTVQENRDQAGALSFWMANASELLHFLKQDCDVSRFSVDAQDVLAEAVQVAFRHLVSCMQLELRNTMGAFLVDMDDDVGDDGNVLHVLSSAMSLLRRCRVNAALTIQLFSQLFHYINMWLFNKLVLEPHLQLCTRHWGDRLRRRLRRIEQWAEKQGLELAADCHLARIIQAAHLLEAPKSIPDDIASISSTCFKLNSLQLRALLQNYISGPGEPRIPPDLIESVVTVAENTADELTRSDGRQVQLEEEPDLQLPFLLPEDGYSCDIIRGVPNGLAEFLDPLSQTGLCRLTIQPMAPGHWTVYMTDMEDENLRSLQNPGEGSPTSSGKDAEILSVSFEKVHGSMGLSIVAAKGEGQEKRGIYIKSVVPGGAAALDGRLQAGDQLLEVDGRSLVGLTQEKAAELMTKTGQHVKLVVAKQGAIYHGLATLLSQPSPIMQRNAMTSPVSPNKRNAAALANKMMGRPKSEDVSRFNESPASSGPMMNNSRDYPGQQGMYGARSSPALANARSHDNLPREDGYGSYPGHPGYPAPKNALPQSASYHNMPEHQREPPTREQALRSKSTSQLDRHEPNENQPYRQVMSTSTLPHGYPNHHLPPQSLQQKFASQPDLQQRPNDGRPNYENYPGPVNPPRGQPGYGGGGAGDDSYNRDRYEQPHYMNHTELRQFNNREPQKDVRPTQSMGNLREVEQQQKPDPMGGLIRHKSEEFDRVHEWQQRNEMERRRMQQQQQQGSGAPPYNNYNPSPMPGYGPPPTEHSRNNENIARGPMGGPGQPQGAMYPNGRPAQPRETTPSYEMRRGDIEQPQRQAPEMVAPNKPQIAAKPMKPDAAQHLPPGMYDPRQQQQAGSSPSPYQMGYPGPGQGQGYPGSQPQSTNQMPPHSAPPQSRYPTNDNHPMSRRPDMKQAPPNRLDAPPYGGVGYRNHSPDLPPPPDIPPEVPPPPPADNDKPPEELPPPPPTGQPDYDRQIQEEQEKMKKRIAGTGADRVQPQGQDSYDPRYRGYQPDRPPQQNPMNDPRYHQPQQKAPSTHFNQNAPSQNFANYQNLPGQPSHQRPTYPYIPKQEPSQPEPAKQQNRPPVAQKPRLVIKPSDLQKAPSPSPWEREKMEKEKQRQKEEGKARLEAEIYDLERKPYLTPEEQDRISKLRLEQEFQLRLEEVSKNDEDEDVEGEPDITERASGRAKMLRMIQEDLERTRQGLIADRHKREVDQDKAEAEKIERQERRIQMFEREREEQRQREYRRQEKRERETEEYLKKQRELREQARRQQEENLRQQRLEDERRREKEREELRKRRESEREQMREMQAAREAEERAMREQARRQEEDAARLRMKERVQEREREKQEERQRMEKYGHLQYNDPAFKQQSQGPPPPVPSQPPPQDYYPPGPAQNKDPYPPGHHYAPPPPERNSSYDIANQVPPSYRSQSASNLSTPTPDANNLNGGPRPGSSAGMNRSNLDPYGAKKSVSFDSNLTTEIHTHPYPSTSSETSLGFQPNALDAGGPTPQNPTYIYGRGSSSGSSLSEPPPQYFQRGSYGGPGGTPNTPSTNEVFEPSYQTPENQAINNNQTLVVSSTPGVVGAQEIYRDPRDRIARQKDSLAKPQAIPERMSFRDKMKMFATEIGENTPVERPKISRAQRDIETTINNGR